MIYDNYYSTFYLVQGPVVEARYSKEAESINRFIKHQLPEDKKSKILELGCGVGFFLFLLRQNGYTNILGIDISEEALALCRKYATESCLRGDILAELKKLQNPGNHYDLIVAFDFMEHFDKTEIVQIFALCHNLLNKNGKFVLKVGNMANITGSHLFHMDFTHRTGFTEESLRHLFTMSGFSGCDFSAVEPVMKTSRFKAWLERFIHRFIYWIERVRCPKVTSRKIIAVGHK